MSRARHRPAALCRICQQPARDTTICRTCLGRVERDLGDVAALTAEVKRVFTADTERAKGSDAAPLVRSRPRRLVPTVDPVTRSCPLDPATLGPVLEPEPLSAGEFARMGSTPWDAEHGLGHEIDATVARQTATKPREGGRSASKPLPFNDFAARVAAEVHATLGSWVRDLHDDAEPWPVDDVVPFAAWLMRHLDRIATHPAAEQIERDVHRAVEALRRAIDRPADRWWLGPCDTDGCLEEHLLVDDDGRSQVVRRPTELYAAPDAAEVTCRNCKAAYPVEDRRAYLLAAAEDVLAHAELIGRAAPALGIEITPDAVRGYAHRKRIVAKGTDLQGRPLYRVGDVLTVAQDALARRAEKHARESRRERSERSA